MHVLGDGKITGIQFSDNPLHADFWPGIRIGASREVVLRLLDSYGLEFRPDGLLQQVDLHETGQP
jgi:hypothetical protein